MLTKTLTFETDVLEVLRSMRWEDDGRLGVITAGQLERGLYQRLNKALEAMGGKWNRKAGGHVFQSDPRPQVEGLLDDGTLEVARDGFFETPEAVVDRMLQLVPVFPDQWILEPSAGLGAIARVLVARGARPRQLKCVEIDRSRVDALLEQGFRAECADFLAYEVEGWDRVYMNPPFEQGQDIDHVRHAYSLLAPGGRLVSVMSDSAFFRGDRKATEFRAWVAEINGYSEKLPRRAFHESGTDVATRLLCLEKPL